MIIFVIIISILCFQISVTAIENSVSALYLTFENVVISKMAFLNEELMRLFNLIADNANEDFNINENRMNSVIRRFALKQLLAVEKEPQKEIAMALIGDVLYGKSYNDVNNYFCV